jgi:hypothetical protein
MLRSPVVAAADIERVMAQALGAVVQRTAEVPFTHSDYYRAELGPHLARSFLAFEGLRDPGDLATAKLHTNDLEEQWREDGRRQVNLDPGMLGLGQMVLASCKPAAHRVYLGQGVYGELEYLFERSSFRSLPWTYPDYREPWAIAFFNVVREGHRVALKESRWSAA